MPATSLVTKGKICKIAQGSRTIFTLPFKVQLKTQDNFNLQLKPVDQFKINIKKICE